MNDNKLIAEFMGLVVSDRDNYTSELHTNVDADLKYHTSWDWLMPVAQKCRLDSRCEYDDDDFWNNIHWALEECNLALTYKAVVEFIKNSKDER
jgi:hypothetical protein|tara:strand:- start:1429 stop:1710 length:282 start_codon:yes stop_codon:yes gene_type:complete